MEMKRQSLIMVMRRFMLDTRGTHKSIQTIVENPLEQFIFFFLFDDDKSVERRMLHEGIKSRLHISDKGIQIYEYRC